MILSIKACVKIAVCSSAHGPERPLSYRWLFSDLHFCDLRTKLHGAGRGSYRWRLRISLYWLPNLKRPIDQTVLALRLR